MTAIMEIPRLLTKANLKIGANLWTRANLKTKPSLKTRANPKIRGSLRTRGNLRIKTSQMNPETRASRTNLGTKASQVNPKTEASQVNPMNLPGFGLYECQQGMVYIMTTGTAGAGFAGLVEMMDEHGQAGDLKEEPHWSFIQTQMNGANLRRLLTEDESRDDTQRFLDHLEELVTAFMRAHPAAFIYEEGQKRRVLVGLIATPEDISGDAHLADRDWFLEVEDAGRGKTLRYPGFPFRMHATPPTLRRPAPLLGQHTAEVLAEAGLPAEEIAALEATP